MGVCEERGLSCKGPHHQDFKSLILRKKKEKKPFSSVFMQVHVVLSMCCTLYFALCHVLNHQ